MCPMAPAAISDPKRSGACTAITINLQISIRKTSIRIVAPTNPSSSQMIEKIISFCASGTNPSFWMLSPNPLPNSPPEPIA